MGRGGLRNRKEKSENGKKWDIFIGWNGLGWDEITWDR